MNMIKPLTILSVLLAINTAGTHAQTAVNPVVKGFGTIYDIPYATKPDADLVYRIVIDLRAPVDDPEKINEGLNNIARILNLHVAGGISEKNLVVVAAIHGEATSVVLDNEGYRQKHGIDNPNLTLVSSLKQAGVKLYACGQSLVVRGYGFDHINPEMDVALSMLTVVTQHVAEGYTPLIFQ